MFLDSLGFDISSVIFLFSIFKNEIEITLKIQNQKAAPKLWTFSELFPSLAISSGSYYYKKK